MSDISDRAGKALRYLSKVACVTPRCLATYLVNGLIIVIPLIVTLWLLIWAFNLVDGILGPSLEWALGRSIPGLGFGIMLFLVVLIGYLGVRFGHRKAFDLFESGVIRIPVVGTIYGGARQIIESFTTNSSNKFLEVILMEFPRKGIYTIGLVTSTATGSDGNKLLNVFIPTAPNPTSGFLQIVPESDVVRTDMAVNEAMKMIISAGKITPDDMGDMLMKSSIKESRDKALRA